MFFGCFCCPKSFADRLIDKFVLRYLLLIDSTIYILNKSIIPPLQINFTLGLQRYVKSIQYILLFLFTLKFFLIRLSNILYR